MMKNILLVYGGDGSEHAISRISAAFLEKCLAENPDYRVLSVCLSGGRYADADGITACLTAEGQLMRDGQCLEIAAAVPCFHGHPGETGQFQAHLEMLGIPYIGCAPQASLCCFNKITAKLYFNALHIPSTPFIMLSSQSPAELESAHAAFERWGDVFVKAACQGSSIGCYHVTQSADLGRRIAEAFGYSRMVLIEQTVRGRELEVAAYEYDGVLQISSPGEILTPDEDAFYTFDEKYAASSQTATTLEPQGLSAGQLSAMRELARRAFTGLQLRDLSRIDFFLSSDGELLLNEINTFPGMTPISMFPKLLEHSGHDMIAFLTQCIARAETRRAAHNSC